MPELTNDDKYQRWDTTFRKMGVYPLFHDGLGVLVLVPHQGDMRKLASDVYKLGQAIIQHATEDLQAEAVKLEAEIAQANVQRQGNGGGAMDPNVSALMQAVTQLSQEVRSLKAGGPVQAEAFAEPAGPATALPPAQRRRRAPRSDGKPPAEGESRAYGREVVPLNPNTMGRPDQGGGFA